MKLFLLLVLFSAPILAQTNVQGQRYISTLDATASTVSKPSRLVTSDPSGACSNSNEVVISSASGNLFSCLSSTWHAIGAGGSPGGSNNDIQINNSGAFGGGRGTISSNGYQTLPGGIALGSAGLYTGAQNYQGILGGNPIGFTVPDLGAPSNILYILPSAAGAPGQLLSDTGVSMCPTLDPILGTPVCHLLLWATVSGGGGGTAGAIASNFVITDESTASTSYVDLTTPDSTSFTLAASTVVLIDYTAYGYMTSGSGSAVPLYNIVNVDGSNIAATESFIEPSSTFNTTVNTSQYSLTLAAGAHTVKIQHKVGSSTGHWAQRLLTINNGTSGTPSNCSSSASPAVCGSASAGSVTIAAAATSVVVNTTAVTANSQIFVQQDAGLGTKLSVTCYSALQTAPWITARTAGVSFTITATAPAVLPACFSYSIVN